MYRKNEEGVRGGEQAKDAVDVCRLDNERLVGGAGPVLDEVGPGKSKNVNLFRGDRFLFGGGEKIWR